MAIETRSAFYFGHNVTASNNRISFDEGSGELNATIEIGAVTLTTFASRVAAAMTSAGTQTYSASVDRSTREITISASSNFSLLVSSGSTTGTSAYSLIGFTGADRSGSNSYTGNNGSGQQYRPQFWLMDYVPKENLSRRIDTARNQSSSGKVEVISFGRIEFVKMNITYITNISQGANSDVIETNLTGVADANTFMRYITEIRPIEFMPDRDAPNTKSDLLLEKTPSSGQGTDYELKELLGRGLAGYYETGELEFRVIV